VNRLGRPDHQNVGFRDRDQVGGGGYACSNGNRPRHGRDGNRGPDPRGAERPRQRFGLPRLDRQRHLFLPDVQCAACKRVGHVATHCNTLATAICLERYVKHALLASARDNIKKEWLAKWKERLGQPAATPRQVMHAYVKELDITVANLDKEMDWECWEDNFDPIPEIVDA
jgi:hypothetical protein